MTPFVPTLAELRPDARFVVLIRDCFSWMDSLLEHWTRVARDVPGEAGLVVPGAPTNDWATVSSQLRAGRPSAGLAATLVKTWAETYTRLLAEVPGDRTLVVRTEDIHASGPRLGALCGVDPATLRMDARRNVAPGRRGVLAALPQDIVVREAERWCAPLSEEYWGPEWRALATRVPAWARADP
jgi:hypothetical protein